MDDQVLPRILNVEDDQTCCETVAEVLQVATQKRPDAKIVMMSAAADPEIVQQAMDSGATRLLLKPFRAKERLQTIEELLGSTPELPPA